MQQETYQTPFLFADFAWLNTTQPKSLLFLFIGRQLGGGGQYPIYKNSTAVTMKWQGD